MSEVLGINTDKFISIVCISSQAKVRVNSKFVVRIYMLVKYIKSYRNELLSNYIEAYNTLVSRNIKGYTNSRMHVKSVKEIKKVTANDLINKCPLCGGELVNRQSKYGSFIGCSNYPRCKFKK